jgi:GNAT superfamily N-acetyltransferase
MMELTFKEAGEQDIPALTVVMTRAFDDDARRHRGMEKGGPEGYDNGDFFRKWLLPYQESIGYKIFCEGKVIGGFIVWILPDSHNSVGTMFVDQEYQNKGVGTQAWQFIESTWPETKSWILGTPSWATRNHHFYEQKCGFTKIREEETEEFEGTIFVYQKIQKAN